MLELLGTLEVKPAFTLPWPWPHYWICLIWNPQDFSAMFQMWSYKNTELWFFLYNRNGNRKLDVKHAIVNCKHLASLWSMEVSNEEGFTGLGRKIKIWNRYYYSVGLQVKPVCFYRTCNFKSLYKTINWYNNKKPLLLLTLNNRACKASLTVLISNEFQKSADTQ